MYIPTTKIELIELDWEELDVIIVTGDAYIDTPYDGAAVIGKWLIKNGFKVGIISQPTIKSSEDILRLGIPKLFWGVTAGCVDSMVANYTATNKRRNLDDLTPGGQNILRPDRATIKYVNLIRQYCKTNVPIVIGGIEASLRRIAHYDYWDNKIRRSILFDSKADFLIYGMAEKSILEFAEAIKNHQDVSNIRGLCYISKAEKNDYIQLPSFEEVSKSNTKFIEMFEIFYSNNEPSSSKGLCQKTGDRYLIHNPPHFYPTQSELDSYFELDFEYDAHPFYKQKGKINALETIKQSIISHRGCFGECNFCAIAIHQGRKVVSRSVQSIVREAQIISSKPDFNGIIYDVGGPSANMYGMDCKQLNEHCNARRCLYPQKCKNLSNNHNNYLKLLEEIAKIPKIRKIFISSGIRFDLALNDKVNGEKFIRLLAEKYVSGQLKIAPEHISNNVLSAMGKKVNKEDITIFRNKFMEYSKKAGKKQYLTYYFMAAHPGCLPDDMIELKNFSKNELRIFPEQIQIFTPTPSTYSTLMYYTEYNPFTNKKIFVEKSNQNKQKQKDILLNKTNKRRE
ncbi:MAG TPA: YgiQ family radical SAM protein [Candidatus Kapabacteria bacterium]|nr:YgiQ family radical SAM protein [Candidatus Kapabacteria bacterium]